MSEEDRSVGGSAGAGRSRASADASISAAPRPKREILEEDRPAAGSDVRSSASAPVSAVASEPPEEIDNTNDPQQTSASRHNLPRQPARKETFFGIPQSSGAPANVHTIYDDDYETRFPPDPIYQEASDDARVYRVYLEESKKYDAYMTDEAREGLDVLLVFAGLFSAVLTTFVAQTSQSLQPDRATESTLLLREIAALQRAQMNGTSAESVPPTSVDFSPAAIDVWVNGLWFTSLTLSLAAALFAVVIKQWIRQYVSLTSGTLRERSIIHQFRFMGLQKWHVPAFIGILPVLLHLSLAIFFVGLTLFLVPLRRSIASIVGSVSVLVFVAYIGMAVWPLFRIQCPYRTPLTGIIHWSLFLVRKYTSRYRYHDLVYSRFQDEEQKQTARCNDDLVAHAFIWLVSVSANSTVHHVVAQAVGGLSRRCAWLLRTLRFDNPSWESALDHASDVMFADCFTQSLNGPPTSVRKADLLEQLFRTSLQRQSVCFSPLLKEYLHVSAAIESFLAPALGWEVAAAVFLWKSCPPVANRRTIMAEMACKLLCRILSQPSESQTRLPAVVWESLLEAVSSCPKVVIPGQYDKVVFEELERRVCLEEWGRSERHDNYTLPISFEDALCTSEHFVWSLLSPSDNHEGNTLNSEKVQRLVSLVNAFCLRGPLEGSRNIVFGTWKQIVCELQAETVTRKDEDAICVAAHRFLQQRTVFQTMFGPAAVLLPSLSFLYCWTPHMMSDLNSATTDIRLALIEIDMLKVLDQLESIGPWLWSASYNTRNITTTVASLIASVIHTSFESRTVDRPEDSRWYDYLALPENSAAIVSMLTFRGSLWTPASAAQVKSDLGFFFASRSWDCEMLQNCRVSLEPNLKQFVSEVHQKEFKANVEEVKRVIDGLISKIEPQPPKPANRLGSLLRRSRLSVDAEAR